MVSRFVSLLSLWGCKMAIIGLILMAVSLTMLVGCMAQVVRLGFWSNFIEKEIERVYQLRCAGDRTTPWVNVHASYDNFKWYQPFHYNFKSMIVYDTTR